MSSSKIKKYLKDKNIGIALKLLSDRIQQIGNYNLKNEYDEAESTYRAMLTYLLQGYKDNEYVSRREELVRNLFAINDQADRLNRINSANIDSRYTFALKSCENKTSIEHAVLRLEVDLPHSEHEEELSTFFNYVWTSDLWSKGQYELAIELLNSSSINDSDKAVFVSAVTLSLMEMFDIRKLHLLFDAYLSNLNIVSQRALVGMVLILRLYDSRLTCYLDILSRLSIYAEDPHFINDFFSTLLTLQYSSITDKVTEKVVNELYPQFLAKKNDINKGTEDIIEEMKRNGENPEWASGDKFERSIKEMAELQTEGADIYMGTFRYMKGYSFFNKIPHWFYPFDAESPVFNNENHKSNGFFKLIQKNSVFCDSDMYSFCFMLNSISDTEKSILSSQLKEQINDEEMEILEGEVGKKKITNAIIRKNYIFDLYRFFVCYPFHSQFDNPFKMKRKNADGSEHLVTFSPLETNAFSFLYSQQEEIIKTADFFMRKGFYSEALDLFNATNPEQTEENASIWQKIGFCKQKLGKEKSAYKTYLLADNLLPDSKWTMSHIMSLAMKLEHYDVALDYLNLLLTQDNNNIKYITNKAICQMKMGNYAAAIPTLFKANYIDEDSSKIICMLIECYIKTGQFEKAEDKIISVLQKDDCPMELRMLNVLLTIKTKSAEQAYYSILETRTHRQNDIPFDKYFNDTLNEYNAYLGIDIDYANMLLDSTHLDIR